MSKSAIAIVNMLHGSASVTALVGSGTSCRVYPTERPAGETLPAVTVRQTDTDPSDTKDGVSTLDQCYISVFVFGVTYEEMSNVSEAIRSALDRQSGTFATVEVQSVQYLREDDDVEEISGKLIYWKEIQFKARIVR